MKVQTKQATLKDFSRQEKGRFVKIFHNIKALTNDTSLYVFSMGTELLYLTITFFAFLNKSILLNLIQWHVF